MEILLIIFFFILGTTLGSFYNVVGLRLPNKESFYKKGDRSYCPNCKKQLAWWELIPVLSYMVQGGKCRGCKHNISFIYPTGELLTGLLFALSYIRFGLEVELFMGVSFVSMLMIIFISDISYMLIPNKILLFFLPFFIIVRIIQPLDPWWSSVTGAVTGFGLIFIIILLSRGGMGAGDMKLFGVLGLVLGFEKVILAFFLACLIGAFVGIVLMVLKIVKRKQPIPFGPFIVIAALISYFFGDAMVAWYVSLLI
ncbi:MULTISPECIES: prepilin peptidase [Oceanobacillus]|uniref:Prepilin peptidase n=1 Tax=Oceanobacillus profundus TaxID=372463 RepID=A0A417YIN4_9BACI|nr:A24 family peptidase [Oceanobacillus profundus]MBR3119563.1 prepilin peptidase [Oceanobacillus sp.]MCM3398451.1 A24 family peptidase [Oceanobacillus profundus]PAE30875.1 prepilin peptidase [Paenibacillus sp. 7884-2]RHW32926.1 prepilin peptidase [Oceanobacillus profundus]